MKKANYVTFFLFLSISIYGCFNSNDNNKRNDTAFNLSQKLWQDYQADLIQGNPIEIAQNFSEQAKLVYPNMRAITSKESIQKTLSKMFPKIKVLEFNFNIEDCFWGDSVLFNYIIVKEKYLSDSVEKASVARISSVWHLNSNKVWKMSLFHVNYENQ